jgi:hypothetical protein
MATQSIMKNILITDSKAAEFFIDAVEKAAEASETSTPHQVDSEELKGEDIKEFLGTFVK